MSSYRNKVVVISGASAGVGRATAVEFARQGASVALLARGQAGLEGARAEVEAAGGRAWTCILDVADAQAVDKAAARIEAELGPIQVWVNNAMVTVLAPRFGYGARPPRCEPHVDGCSLWDEDGQRLRLHSDLPLQLDPDQASASFQIAAGQRLYFVLQHLQADEQPAVLEDMQKLLHDCRH